MLPKIDKLQNYHPTYWLSSLGAGGIAITFFMYLMWLIPKETPIPTFADWTLHLNDFNFMTIISLFSVAGFLLFSFLHFYLINWNIKAFKAYGDKFKSHNIHNPAHLQLMSIPLSFAMSINVMFVAGSLFVPNIWNVIEYLFPFAIIAFSIIGFYSLKFYAEHINHIFSYQIKFEEFNSFAAMMPAFTFLMVSVGLAAPSAMSLNETTVVIAIILSRLFLITAILTMLISVFIGIKAILQHGFRKEASPSLLMFVPFLTLSGIEWLRLNHGFSHVFLNDINTVNNFSVLLNVIILQSLIFAFGIYFMIKNNYIKDVLNNKEIVPNSFGLACPFVGYFVMGMFFVHVGLIQNNIISLSGFFYPILIISLFVFQIYSIYLYLKLFKYKHK